MPASNQFLRYNERTDNLFYERLHLAYGNPANPAAKTKLSFMRSPLLKPVEMRKEKPPQVISCLHIPTAT